MTIETPSQFTLYPGVIATMTACRAARRQKHLTAELSRKERTLWKNALRITETWLRDRDAKYHELATHAGRSVHSLLNGDYKRYNSSCTSLMIDAVANIAFSVTERRYSVFALDSIKSAIATNASQTLDIGANRLLDVANRLERRHAYMDDHAYLFTWEQIQHVSQLWSMADIRAKAVCQKENDMSREAEQIAYRIESERQEKDYAELCCEYPADFENDKEAAISPPPRMYLSNHIDRRPRWGGNSRYDFYHKGGASEPGD